MTIKRRLERLELLHHNGHSEQPLDYQALAYLESRSVLMVNLSLYPPMAPGDAGLARNYDDPDWQEQMFRAAWDVGATFLECFGGYVDDDTARDELITHANELDADGCPDLSMQRLPAVAMFAFTPPGSLERYRHTTIDERLAWARLHPDELEAWRIGNKTAEYSDRLIAEHGEPLFVTCPHECFDREH